MPMSHTSTEARRLAGAQAMLATLSGADAESDATEYLAFRLGGVEYAIDILDVQEIRSYEQPLRMLGASPFVPGVLNLRGTIVPVVDLRSRLSLPTTIDGRTVIVVLNLQTATVGVVVDAVSDVVELPCGGVQPMPAFNDSDDAPLFHGMACLRQNDQERTLIVMNLRNLLPGTVASIPSASLPL